MFILVLTIWPSRIDLYTVACQPTSQNLAIWLVFLYVNQLWFRIITDNAYWSWAFTTTSISTSFPRLSTLIHNFLETVRHKTSTDGAGIVVASVQPGSSLTPSIEPSDSKQPGDSYFIQLNVFIFGREWVDGESVWFQWSVELEYFIICTADITARLLCPVTGLTTLDPKVELVSVLDWLKL